MVKSYSYFLAIVFMMLAVATISAAIVYTSLSPRLDPETIIVNNTIYDTDNKALITFYMSTWGPNLDNEKEVIFSGWVYNFGYTEAKNVTMECPIYIDKKEINKLEFSAGNVASTSYKYFDFTKEYSIPEGVTGTCRIKSCDNCINLDSRLPIDIA